MYRQTSIGSPWWIKSTKVLWLCSSAALFTCQIRNMKANYSSKDKFTLWLRLDPELHFKIPLFFFFFLFLPAFFTSSECRFWRLLKILLDLTKRSFGSVYKGNAHTHGRERNIYRLIATDIWNAMKTNMTVCECFVVDVIICCRHTACGMPVFGFCTLCVSRYLCQEKFS